jgi:hypothetical protein
MQVYRFYGDLRALEEIRDTLVRNADGGTLAVYLGISALSHGFGATLYPFDLEIFDPTWFKLDPEDGDTLRGKSRAAVFAYRDFLLLGGKIKFREPEPRLLVSIINRGHPVLCGLSATWLYKTPRECPDGSYDDARVSGRVVRRRPRRSERTFRGHLRVRPAGRALPRARPERARPIQQGRCVRDPGGAPHQRDPARRPDVRRRPPRDHAAATSIDRQG